jgi:hypothetical protein
MVEMSAQEIYDNFHDGVGGDGLASGAAMVRKVAARYEERVALIHQLEAEMDAAWQGEAAGAAQRGAGPLLTEHDLASHHLGTVEDLSDRQSGSFSRAKNSVVPVPPMPTGVQPFGPLAADWVPFKQQITDHYEATQRNVDVMNVYSGASAYNTDHLPATYGALADDQAGISIARADTIDVGDSGEPMGGDAPGPREFAPGPRPASDALGSTAGPGSVVLPPGNPTPPAGHSASPGGSATTPDGYTPVTSGPLGTPGVDIGQQRPVANAGGFVPGVGIGFPGGGNSAESVRGGPGATPWRGVMAGAETPGSGVRASSAAGSAAGRSVGVGGVPVGRGRADEDRDRKAPAYLEAGDPDELFGSDVLTAPAVIGDEDDD